MNALDPHMAESGALKLVGLFRHGKLLPVERAKQFDALVSLALAQRRHAQDYRRWAREAEAAGNLDRFRHYAKLARESFRGARFHIEHARMRLQ
jgi:hypothetical protein